MLNQEWIEKFFMMKILLELTAYKLHMLQCRPQEIFASAYEIDTMVCIYEILEELYEEGEALDLEQLIAVPELLTFLYDQWIETENYRKEELYAFVEKAVQDIGGGSVR